MPPRQRPYRPKVKGCYECSQRRVSCDRGSPECTKCLSKGLRCSGLDLRYRFTEGVTIRGKWAGESVKSLYNRCKDKAEKRDAREWQTPRHCWTDHQNKLSVSGSSDSNNLYYHDSTHQYSTPESQDANDMQGFLDYLSSQELKDFTMPNKFDEEPHAIQVDSIFHSVYSLSSSSAHGPLTLFAIARGDCGEVGRGHTTQPSTGTNSFIRLLYEPLPDNISCWEQYLLSNYSNHIAKEMLAIDGPHNGWRYLVLPVAHRDKMVMNAVLTASSFHMSFCNDSRLNDGSYPQSDHISPDRLYELTIQGLKCRDLAECDHEGIQSIMITILVLLTAVMVNGRNDFPILFSLLDSATNVIGGEEQLAGNELGDFILRQVRKMRVYASPLISEQAGLNILSSKSQWDGVFDCLRYCSQKQPKHAVAAALIEDIIHQAREIYLRQSSNEITIVGPEWFSRETNLRLQRFKETIESFPAQSPGKQVLIWAIFMAASSCIQEEDKTFFESMVMENFSRSKFINLLKGFEQLKHIWTRGANGVRWTYLLPQARLFLM